MENPMNNRMILPFAALAIAAAACSSSSGTKTAAPAAQPTSAAPAANGGATVALGSSSKLGKILVNAKGQTLYLWQKDSGTTSACSGACASAWPPVTTTGTPTAGTGLTASMLGTTKRSDGTMQVTYGGHPLYTFVQDSSPGDANGEGSNAFGAPWYAVNAGGAKVVASTGSQGGY
jgi:predicted lipoprotein with Yx(FWY)xxD motif